MPDLRQPVNFHQRHPGEVAAAAHDRGVSARRQRLEDRGLQVICRRKVGRFDVRLLRLLPVVVAPNEGAVSIVQFQGGISERAGHRRNGVGKRRSQGPDHDAGVSAATTQDEAPDHDIAARLDKAAGY